MTGNQRWPRALLAAGQPYAHAASACWAGEVPAPRGQPRQHDARSSDGAGRSLESQASLGFPSRKAFPAVKDHGGAGLPRECRLAGSGLFLTHHEEQQIW